MLLNIVQMCAHRSCFSLRKSNPFWVIGLCCPETKKLGKENVRSAGVGRLLLGQNIYELIICMGGWINKAGYPKTARREDLVIQRSRKSPMGRIPTQNRRRGTVKEKERLHSVSDRQA